MIDRDAARLVLVALVLPALAGSGSAPVASPGSADAVALAEKLRRPSRGPGGPGERWGRRSPGVVLENGAGVPRESAYRDEPAFVLAASELLRNRNGDDALL